MEVRIRTIEANGRVFMPLKAMGDFTLAQEVLTIHEPFKPIYQSLSDHYTLLKDSTVICRSSSREFHALEQALTQFKAP